MINGSFRTILLLGNYIIHYSNFSSFITNEDHTQNEKILPVFDYTPYDLVRQSENFFNPRSFINKLLSSDFIKRIQLGNIYIFLRGNFEQNN